MTPLWAWACIAGATEAVSTAPADSLGKAKLVQTASGGDRLAERDDLDFVPDFSFAGVTVEVSRDNKDQTIVGFGGAFTEAASTVFRGLSEESKTSVVEHYWGETGIGYTTGRVHINSCDFSVGSYSFDDSPDDYSLLNFDHNVSRDMDSLIPFIAAAQTELEKNGRGLKLLATPWSPPAWMKTNGKMDRSGSPGLKDNCHSVWALYISNWIKAYKAHGINIWAITPQNEPENNASWEACMFTPKQEMDFLGEDLGPTLLRDHPEVQIFVYDHNKDHIFDWAQALWDHPTAGRYAAGVAFHWYSGDSFDTLAKTHSAFPTASLLASEATYEQRRWKKNTTIQDGDWSFGEGYAHDIIGDLNAGAVGWIDWNLLLYSDGTPNHAGNPCDAAMMADGDEVFLHPQYYYIGHFSKYLLPGSQRIQTDVKNSTSYNGNNRGYGVCGEVDGLEATSFIHQDNLVATVVLNCGGDAVQFKLRDGARALNATIPAHGIQTYLFGDTEPGVADDLFSYV